MKTALLLTLALGAAGVFAGPGLAQYKLDPNAPMGVASDALDHSDSNCTTTLAGQVELTQDRVRIRANNVRVVNERQGSNCRTRVSRMEAAGNVFFVTPDRTVRADNAIYVSDRGEYVFTGNVVAIEGKDVSTADRMVLNSDTNAVSLSGRVRGVFYPEESGAAR